MSTVVARPAQPTVLRLRATWACVCGRQRQLVTTGVRTDLDLAARAPAGACTACGFDGDRYRVETTPNAYVVHIERG